MTTTTTHLTPCDTCTRAGVIPAEAVDPHTHCDRCDGAILPGMDACAWCGRPVEVTVHRGGRVYRCTPEIVFEADLRTFRAGGDGTRYEGRTGAVHVVAVGTSHSAAWSAVTGRGV